MIYGLKLVFELTSRISGLPKCRSLKKVSWVLVNISARADISMFWYRSFSDFALHLHTNTIGPVIIAQKLLTICSTNPPAQVVFISSDSGSTALFRDHEDGFGAYAASKAALNQMLRHMAAELKRKGGQWEDVCVLAIHPGEVQT